MANGLYHVILYAMRDKSKDWICPDCEKYQEYPNNVGYSLPKLVCRFCGSEKVVVNRNSDSK